MITRWAAGKLFVAGEYAVVEPGTPAVLVAVDRYVSVSVDEPATAGCAVAVRSDLAAATAVFDRVDGRLRSRTAPDGPRFEHVVAGIEVVDGLMAELGVAPRRMCLSITSQLHDRGTKLGLGSSGAVTVATVTAVAAFYGCALSRRARFRLALLAAARLDPRGSGGDIAASAWGGWIGYWAPDRDQILELARRTGLRHTVHSAEWPGCRVRPLPAPDGIAVQVGWTGRPAATTELVAELHTNAWRDGPAYRDFLRRSTDCVLGAMAALRACDDAAFREHLHTARNLLHGLDAAARLGIFTDRLTALCDAAESLGGAAKPSGAGGGDCGIAVLDAAGPPLAALRARWHAAGIVPLALHVPISQKGLIP